MSVELVWKGVLLDWMLLIVEQLSNCKHSKQLSLRADHTEQTSTNCMAQFDFHF